MTPEELWRRKSDEELIAASTRLAEYTEIGQRIILDEIRRRDLAVMTVAPMDSGESADAGLSPVSARVHRKSQLHMARLWRGEVSLPVTYWVWGALFNSLMRLLIVLVLFVTYRSLVVGIGLAVLYLAYCVFIIVAIWRSSARYTGPRIWRDLARVSLALVLIIWAADRLLGE